MNSDRSRAVETLLRDAYQGSPIAVDPDPARLRRRLDRGRAVERRVAVAVIAAILLAIAVPAVLLNVARREALPARGGPLDVGVVAGDSPLPRPGAYAAPVRAQVAQFARTHGTSFEWRTVHGDAMDELATAAARQRTVIVAGGSYLPATRVVARRRPGTHFFVLDASGRNLPANVTTLPVSRVDAAYSAGAAAAAASTAHHVAVAFPSRNAAAAALAAAFRAGAKAEARDVVVTVKYPGGGTGGAVSVARAELSVGADVIFGDPTALVAVGEARAAGVQAWYIGVDDDYAKVGLPALRPFVLTSVILRLDLLVKAALDAVQAGAPASVGKYLPPTSVVQLATTGGHLKAYERAVRGTAGGPYSLRHVNGSPLETEQ